MLPVFLQHLSPLVGACGERNAAVFFAAFRPQIPIIFNQFFIKKRPGAATRQIWRKLAPPHGTASKARYFSIKTGRCRNEPNLAKHDTATCHRLKCSLLFDQNPLFRLGRIRPSLNKPQRTLKSSELVAREQPMYRCLSVKCGLSTS